MVLDDLLDFSNKIQLNYPRAILIEVFKSGYEVLEKSLDNNNRIILKEYNIMFGIRVIVVNDSKDFRFDQARITYNNGDTKIIKVLE